MRVNKTAKVPLIIGYARVSTKDQSEDSNALEQQIARLKATGVEQILVDVESGREGKESDRPNFQKMMEWVKKGLVKQVIITRIDRLSRSLTTLRKTLTEFQQYNCHLLALDDNIDLSTASGKFHVNMLGALAEMESDRLSERIRHGKEHFRRQLRASHPPFGYRTVNFRFEVDRNPFLSTIDGIEWSRGDMAVWLVEQYLERKSLGGTCKAFVEKFGYQPFWTTALSRWLTSPTLQGHLVYFPKSPNPQIHRDVHEPLISPEQARAIEQTLRFNHKVGGWGSRRGVYPLSGLVECGNCGAGCIVANGSKGKIQYMVCSKSRYKLCSPKGIRTELIEQVVVNTLTGRADTLTNIAQTSANTEPDSPQIQQLQAQLLSLQLIPGNNPAIQAAITQIESQIAQLRYSLSQGQEIDSVSRDLLLWAFSDPECWKSAVTEDKKRVYRELVEKIIVKNGQVVEVKLKI